MSAAVVPPSPGGSSTNLNSANRRGSNPSIYNTTPVTPQQTSRPVYEGEVSTPLLSPTYPAMTHSGPAPAKLHQSRAQQVKAQALSGSPLVPSSSRQKSRPLTSSNAHNLPSSATTTPVAAGAGGMVKPAKEILVVTTPVASTRAQVDPSTPSTVPASAPPMLEDGLTPNKLKRLSLIRDKTKDASTSTPTTSGSAEPKPNDGRTLSPTSAPVVLTPSTPRRHARQAGLRSSISYSPAFRTGADLAKALSTPTDGTHAIAAVTHAHPHLPSTLRGPGTPARGTPGLSAEGPGTGGKHRISRSIDGLDELGVGMEPAHEPLHIGGEGVVKGKKEGQNKKGETLSEKHADLLTLIAQKERRVNELKQELVQQEASLATLKARWTSIVSRSAPLFQAPPLTPTGSTAGSPAWPISKTLSSDGTEPSGTTSSPSLSSLTDSEGTSYLHEMRSDAVADGLWTGLLERALGQGTEQGLISPQAIEGGRRFWGNLMRTMGAAGSGSLPSEQGNDCVESRSPGENRPANIDFAGLQRTITSWTSALASPTPSTSTSTPHPAPKPANSARLPRTRERERGPDREREREQTLAPESPCATSSSAAQGSSSPRPGSIRLKRAALGRRLRDLAAGEESEGESTSGTPKGATRKVDDGDKENRQPATSAADAGSGEGEHEDLWGW